MSNDKSLRDIWTVTDKMSMDVSRAAGGVPESCNASVITTASGREKCASYVSNQTQESYLKKNFGKHPIPCGLFLQQSKENVDEDETMSLISSIWTPTVRDECVMRKDYQQNPLLVVKIPGKDALQKESKSTISAEDSYEALLAVSSSESELSNNYGSDESQDELNDETFGDSNSVKSEMTMSNISEATAKCEFLKKNLKNGNREVKKSESSDSDHSVNTIIEKNSAKSPKNGFNASTTKITSQTKTKQTNSKTPYIKHYGRRRRNVNTKTLSSKFSRLGMESDEVLSVSRENLTIQESHSSSRKGGRMSNVNKNFAIETREVLGKKGTTKKITYVRGKIVEETNDPPNKNEKWNTNLCNINIQSRNATFQDNSFAFNRVPQTKLVERNSNRLYNTQNIQSSTVRQFKNGRLVANDCLKINEHLNFNRQDRRDFFKPPRKDFEILKKETNKGPLYEPRYKSEVENCPDKRKSALPKKIFPNYPFEVTNRAHLERKIINTSQNYEKTFEEDLYSEVSWNIVKPEKEIERKTMVKKIFDTKMPIQTTFEDESKSCQASIEINQGKKSYPQSKPKNDISYDQTKNHFNFYENLKAAKKEEETETLDKFIPQPPPDGYCVTDNLSFFRSVKLKEERAQKKSLLIKDGKEVADLIVGCHTAVDVFSSFYFEWLELREESINLLEKIMVAIVKCGNKNGNITNLIAGINIAADAAALIPHRGITLGAKIAAVIGGFVAKLFRNEFSEKDRNAKEFEVRQIFQRDIDTSSMVYIYGVQCSSQFEDTCRAIKALHQRTQQDSFDLFMTDTSVIKFLKEISEYNPSNVAVFYKRLRFEYERLIKESQSDEGRAFTRVFEVIPQAIPVIDLLPWKFEPDGFDNSIVMNAWEELFSLFNDNGLSSNDEFLRKVQNCLFFLKKEKAILQRNVQSLLK